MKRDMELIRLLLLKLEALPMRPGAILRIEPGDREIAVEGYDFNTIAYHLSLISSTSLVQDVGSKPVVGIMYRGLTWEGHDFIDSIRDDEIWKRTKNAVNEAGGFSLELVKALAKGFLKKKVEDLTGVEISL